MVKVDVKTVDCLFVEVRVWTVFEKVVVVSREVIVALVEIKSVVTFVILFVLVIVLVETIDVRVELVCVNWVFDELVKVFVEIKVVLEFVPYDVLKIVAVIDGVVDIKQFLSSNR